jgi:hypothetical protein
MSWRSSAGWFWPDFDALPVEPARPPARRPIADLPSVAPADRWAQPAPPPARRAGEDPPAGGPSGRVARPAGIHEGRAAAIPSLNPAAG